MVILFFYNVRLLKHLKNWIISSLRSLTESRVGQISALDGLRSMAITMVIAGFSKNDFIFAGGVAKPDILFQPIGYLWTGVDLFFVLSGFLIGRILFEEVRKTGSVRVIPFLLKRGFRIWPLYYFISGVSLIHLLAIGSLTKPTAILPDLFFLTNYFGETLVLGTWSLSIEEQFYIIASCALFFFRKQIANAPRVIPIFLFSLLLFAPLSRILTWQHYDALNIDRFYIEWELLHSFLHTHYDGLAIGVFLASVQVFASANSFLKTRMGSLLQGGLLVTGILTFFFRLWFLYLFAALAFGAILWQCLTKPNSMISRMMSWSGFQIVSRLSYGMYLWYRFPLWRIARLVNDHTQGMPALFQYSIIFTLAFVAAGALAIVTYVLVERPFLQLRSQLSRSSNNKAIKSVYNLPFVR